MQVDDGAWQPARLGEVANDNTWVQWLYEWQASPGRHQLSVRATDGTGEVQTADSSPPAPDGATGYHSRTVTRRVITKIVVSITVAARAARASPASPSGSLAMSADSRGRAAHRGHGMAQHRAPHPG